jgi:hypothetical protein
MGNYRGEITYIVYLCKLFRMRLCAFPLVKERRLESLNTLATLRWSIRFVRATGASSTGLSNVTADALTVRIVICNLSTL